MPVPLDAGAVSGDSTAGWKAGTDVCTAEIRPAVYYKAIHHDEVRSAEAVCVGKLS